MIVTRSDRWREGRRRYVDNRAPVDPRAYAVDVLESRATRGFIVADHYLPTWPAAQLAVGLHDRVTTLAHAYAGAVGDGPARWLEAGFRAPVEYSDGAAVRIRKFVDVVLGALAVTRPDQGGHFPLAAFARLHAHVADTFPHLAVPFRQTLSGEPA